MYKNFLKTPSFFKRHNINVKAGSVCGFTLLEILMTIAIFTIITVIIVAPLSDFRASRVLDAGVEDVVTILNEARIDTLSSKNNSQYGVHFESTRMVLFKGTTFVEPDSNNKEVLFDSALEMPSILLNGSGVDVVFERLSGSTNQYGTIVLRVKNNPSTSITITIEQTGIAGF